MFRNDQQRGRVCQVLTATIPHGPFFVDDEHGCPRPNASLRTHLGRGFSSSEKVLVRIAWDVWNGFGKAQLDAALHVLDGPNLRKVGSLLVAVGGSSSIEIDRWLHEWAPVFRELPAPRAIGGVS